MCNNNHITRTSSILVFKSHNVKIDWSVQTRIETRTQILVSTSGTKKTKIRIKDARRK